MPSSIAQYSDRQFLEHLSALGIELSAEAGNLRFRAPQGAFTAELRDEVQHRKPRLLALLSAPSVALIPPADRRQPLRMSFAQERIWFLYRFEGPSSTYSITPVFRLRGRLSLEALRQALAALSERHETLRMRFAEVDGIGVQLVDPPAAVPVEIVPLLALPPADRLAAAERLVLERTASPFDLERGPVLRVTLLQLGEDDHILLPFMHHIIGDGWSLGVFHREFGALYEGFVSGRPPFLPPLPIQYPDYAAWQRAQMSGTGWRQTLDAWRQALAGAPQTLALPTDFPRPPVQTFNGRVLRRRIPADLAAALNDLARAQGCSLFMLLLAAYGVLLFRHSGQDDILVGSPVANRPRRETEGLIGCFVNTVVLRLRVDGNPRFTELLQRVRRMALDAYDRQEVPVEAVIDAVVERRDPSRIPLYQAQFSLQNVPVAVTAMTSLAVEAMAMDRVAAKNDLSFILEQGPDGIAAEVEYNTDLFLEATVDSLWDGYSALLRGIVAAPETPIQALPLPTHAAVLAEAPVTATFAPLPFADLVTAFEAAVGQHAEGIAVRDGRQTLTYGALDARADAVAARLLALDLPPETPIGLLAGRSVDLIAGLIGILKAGFAYLPLAPEHPLERLRYCLAQGAAGAVLADGEHAPLAVAVAPTGAPVLIIGDGAEVPRRPRPALTGRNLAYVIFTSGSTGRPKGVMIEHGAVLNLVAGLRHRIYAGLPERLDIALMASTVFDASVQQIFPALLFGHTLCLIDESLRQDGDGLCRQLRDWRIAVTDCTPSLLTIMLGGGLVERCGETLRHILVGGEPLPRDTMLALHASAAGRGIGVSNVYGPTECCVDVTELRLSPDTLGPAATVAIGSPLPNCRLIAVDDQDRPVADGIEGELLIAGPCLARGYVNDPSQTAERFVALALDPAVGEAQQRYYRSGDLVRRRPDGVFEFLGRNDDQVKILGYRIELGEIESRLRKHPSLAAVSVQARTTSGGRREIAAYVVASAPVTRRQLRDFLCEQLPDYMVPAYFVPLDVLPLNASGKVARGALPDPETAAALPSGSAHAAAASEAERALCAVWERTLRLDRVGLHDNYFASGGDSIKALQVAARLRESGWIMEIRDLFRYPTVAQLAPQLRRQTTPAASSGPFVGKAPLSAIQRFFFATYGPAGQFNQAILLRCGRRLEATALQRALAALHAAHDMLRCRFVQEDGHWQQEILAVEAVTPDFDHVDLTGADDPAATLIARCAEAQTAFALARAPLLAARLFDLPDGQRLLLSAHHLIVDGVSWRILLDDLEQLLGGGLTLPPASCGYPSWVEAQQSFAASPGEDLDYWRGIRLPSVPVCADRLPGQTETHADRHQLRVELTEDVTRDLLTEAQRAYSTEINDLLLTALVRAWCAWSGDRQCALTLEGHGREALAPGLDLSRSVGWFTSVFPVAFTLNDDVGSQIKAVKEGLRAIPRKGAGYAPLRYLGDHLDLPPLPPLAFNYLGRFDAAATGFFVPAPETLPSTAAADLPLPWPLEVTAVVVANRLALNLAYSQQRFSPEDANRLLDRLAAELRQVVDHTLGRHTELTVSDIDYDGFSQEGLDDFLASL